MQKIKKKTKYTYYNINLRFLNDDSEEIEMFKKFKKVKRKSDTVKKWVFEKLKGE
jgi:hypothetical protein